MVIIEHAQRRRPARQRVPLGVGLLAAALLAAQPTAQAATTVTRTSSFDYDATTGLLIKEVVEPTNPALCVATVYEYGDGWGNKTKATTRNCNGSATVVPGGQTEAAAPSGSTAYAAFSSRSAITGYSTDGRFATTVTNAEGYQESRVYDPRNGATTSLTGPNQLTTSWEYDALGRRTYETRADGTVSQSTLGYCSNAGITVPANATSASCVTWSDANGNAVTPMMYSVTSSFFFRLDWVDWSSGEASYTYVQLGSGVKTYFDAHGREVRTETQGYDGSGTAPTVYQDTQYDNLGRVVAKSAPYLSGATRYWTTNTYDDLGRVTQTNSPTDTAASGAVSTSSYSGLVTTVTDPNNHTTVQTRNVAGQVVSIQDAKNQLLTRAYDALGNLVRTTDAKGNVTSLEYDLKGRKTKSYDPDMGVWSYQYDALGQLVSQTDAKNQTTTMAYDVLGRMTTRTEGDLVSTWTYNTYAGQTAANSTCTKGVGKLCEVSASNGYKRKHSYDSLGRPISTTTTLGSAFGAATDYTASVTYDIAGRVATQTYPTGLTTENVYTTVGYLQQLKLAAGSGGTVLWTANSANATGQLTQYTYGNGVVTNNGYYAPTGRLNTSQAGPSNGVQSLSHTYDSLGLLKTRVDVLTGVTASYAYDEINRLNTETRSGGGLAGAQVTGWTYDELGNIKTRTEAGQTSTYNYNTSGLGSSRPHAVANVSGWVNGQFLPRYAYDANGNLTGGAGRSVTWTSYNKVASINTSTVQLSYLYDADHERAQEVYKLNGATQRTTVYLNPAAGSGLFYEQESGVAGTKRKHYLSAGGGTFAVITCTATPCTTPSNTSIQYWHKDHLGSTSVVTNATGAVVERLAYEPFGKRRNSNGVTDPNGTLVPTSTDRGYTGHEHLDEVGLVNMNGRIYDPALARFMSADPIVQNPRGLQSFNRYSYGWNSPLSGTDPSGYNFFRELGLQSDRSIMNFTRVANPGMLYVAKQITTGPYAYQAKSIAVAVGSAFCTGWYAACAAAGTFALNKTYGASNDDALKAAAIAGATVAANQWAGASTSGDFWYNVAAHAVIGCVSADASGGDCKTGAAAGAASAAWSQSNWQSSNEVVGFVQNVVVGGTVSVIGGGKFANGAITAAYAYLFNYLGDQEQKGTGNTLPKYSEDQVVLSDDQAQKVLKFFFPNDPLPASMTLETRAFAQGLLYDAVSKSAALNVVQKLWQEVGPVPAPMTVGKILGITKAVGKASADALQMQANNKVYDVIARQETRNFRSYYITTFGE